MIRNNQHPSQRTATYSSSENSKFVDNIRTNVKSDLIEITADKLENILLKHLSELSIRRAWVAPLSTFITALLATLTATFSKKFEIEGPVWQALFDLLAIAALVWLIVSVARLRASWKDCSLDHLMDVIKNAQKKNQQLNTTVEAKPVRRGYFRA